MRRRVAISRTARNNDWPGRLHAALSARNHQLEQAAGADLVALVLRRAAGQVAFGRVATEFRGQPGSRGQRIEQRAGHGLAVETGRPRRRV